MNETKGKQREYARLFQTLDAIEAPPHAGPCYLVGFDSVLHDVLYAVMSGNLQGCENLESFVHQLDALGADNEAGAFAEGYNDAVSACLEALRDTWASVH